MSHIADEPEWLLPFLCIVMTLVAMIIVFSLYHSKYEEKVPKWRILAAVVVALLFSWILLTFIITVVDTIGPDSLFLPTITLVVVVVCASKIICRIRAKRWCAQHTDYCQLKFSKLRVKFNIIRVIKPLSVDKVPIHKQKECFYTYKTLLLPPGKHQIELVISEDRMRMGGHVTNWEIGRFEIQQIFYAKKNYICEMRGKRPKLRIKSCGKRT